MRGLLLVGLAACAPDEPKGDTGDTGADGGPALVCGESADLLGAPAPTDSALGPVAAVDVQVLAATVTAEEDGLAIDATVSFLVGEDAGRPALELGPEPDDATLDGLPVTLDRVLVGDPPREVVLLPELPPCTAHVLRVQHRVPTGWMDEPGGQARLERRDGGTWWSSGQQDDRPNRFLDMWFPSNLLFDRFELELEVHAPPGHRLDSTGEVEVLPDGFRVRWPDRVQAHAPLWVLSPEASAHVTERVATLAEGPVTVTVLGLEPDDLEEAATRAVDALTAFDTTYGPYAHGDRYLVWLREGRGSSMEYAGGTVTALSAIEHEIHHAWFARGASPASDADAWLDEAVTSWATDIWPYREVPFDHALEPQQLRVGDDGWAAAELSSETYLLGATIFAGLADLHGVEAVTDALGTFYRDQGAEPFRDVDLERALYCALGEEPLVREAFARRGYGQEAPVGSIRCR